jgi:hypothetical protein
MIVPAGSLLYRAAITGEARPKTRFCKDTGKTGVYFGAFSPYLSETMAVEYKRTLIVSQYVVTQDIKITGLSKYAHLIDPETGERNLLKKGESITPEQNISHIQRGFAAVDENIRGNPGDCDELFLVEEDLDSIQFVFCYMITPKKARERWHA